MDVVFTDAELITTKLDSITPTDICKTAKNHVTRQPWRCELAGPGVVSMNTVTTPHCEA